MQVICPGRKEEFVIISSRNSQHTSVLGFRLASKRVKETCAVVVVLSLSATAAA